ncbi:hypothetical protein [Polaribacter sp. Hel_I_88]|uniref:hypothetical protein n=1 Tax=Polaribacter sp. Hel_I_88 TaxID=1250006 RepID=UPI00047A1F33|nr:hypothetical protein [Polaribacter sp. Hel_I_88]
MKKILFVIIIYMTYNSTFGQKNKVEYDKIVPEYILAVWEQNNSENNSEFQVKELKQIKSFFEEFFKKENQILTNEFLKKPSENTLVGHYLHKKLKWNSFNGPHVGIKKLKNKKVIKNELKNLPNEKELLAHYYLSIFSDVLNKQRPMNLASTNIDLEKLNLEDNTEKSILILCAMRHIGSQVGSYSTTKFPKNCFRAKEYEENMPKFNGKPFFKYELLDFKDFEIEVDKRYPKMSFLKRYLPAFEISKKEYLKCVEYLKN